MFVFVRKIASREQRKKNVIDLLRAHIFLYMAVCVCVQVHCFMWNESQNDDYSIGDSIWVGLVFDVAVVDDDDTIQLERDTRTRIIFPFMVECVSNGIGRE